MASLGAPIWNIHMRSLSGAPPEAKEATGMYYDTSMACIAGGSIL